MTKRWIMINAALLIVAGLLAWHLRQTMRRFDQENNLATIKPATPAKLGVRQDSDIPPPKPARQYNASEFGSIVAQNLFSDTRTSQKDEVPAVVAEQIPELKDKPILVGVVLDGNQRFASILESNSQGAPPGRRRSHTIRLGDVYQGYSVVDITDDKMVLAYGSRTEIIQLRDTTRQTAKGAKTPMVATRVVNFGGGSTAGVAAPPAVRMAAVTPPESPRPASPAIAVSTIPARTPATMMLSAPSGLSSLHPNAIVSPGTTIGRPTGRGIDTQTNAQVINTPTGPVTVYPP